MLGYISVYGLKNDSHQEFHVMCPHEPEAEFLVQSVEHILDEFRVFATVASSGVRAYLSMNVPIGRLGWFGIEHQCVISEARHRPRSISISKTPVEF